MTSIEALLSVLTAYRDATGLAEATVSTRFLGRGSRLSELKLGSDMGARRVESLLQVVSENWPENAVWPADVPRPGAPPPPEDLVLEAALGGGTLTSEG